MALHNKKFNEFEILPDGKTVKITLTQGQFGYCDLEDWEYLKQYKWYASKEGRTYYIKTNIKINNRNTSTKLHLLIMNSPKNMRINHRDFNGLNCCRYNLEICTHKENVRYCMKPKNNTSGYKGVCWNKFKNKWVSKIKVNYKSIHLGYFDDKIEAAKAYNEASLKYFGNFAFLNDIKEQD